MEMAQVVDGAREALQLALLLAGPPLLAALVVGLVVGVLQTLTQMHDPIVSLVPRLAVVAVVVLALLGWMLDRWVTYATGVLGSIPDWL